MEKLVENINFPCNVFSRRRLTDIPLTISARLKWVSAAKDKTHLMRFCESTELIGVISSILYRRNARAAIAGPWTPLFPPQEAGSPWINSATTGLIWNWEQKKAVRCIQRGFRGSNHRHIHCTAAYYTYMLGKNRLTLWRDQRLIWKLFSNTFQNIS